MVVVYIGPKDSTQMTFVENDDLVETISPNGAYNALDEWILPRRPRCDHHFFDTETPGTRTIALSIFPVTIA